MTYDDLRFLMIYDFCVIMMSYDGWKTILSFWDMISYDLRFNIIYDFWWFMIYYDLWLMVIYYLWKFMTY